MNYFRAKKRAKRISKIFKQTCYVIKVRTPIKLFRLSTWFRFENVTQDYIELNICKGKLYFKTK